jgi:hypothetical protein
MTYNMEVALRFFERSGEYRMNLTLETGDLDVILESLRHYKLEIESYDKYPSYEFKQQQVARVDSVLKRLKSTAK